MRKFLILLLCLCFCTVSACAESLPDTGTLIADLAGAYLHPSPAALARVDLDVSALNTPLASAIAAQWKRTWLDEDYRLLLWGTDSPEDIPVRGKHAFVVLGYALKNGEMTEELTGRCDAAAAAARAFPGSVLVCSGGATGVNNPDRHTEAGLMKDYLSGVCGIDPDRIFTDESAMTTDQNARYTMEILQELQIETATVVTSDYHQLRGQTLLGAMAAKVLQEQGYSLEIVGNWCFKTARTETGELSEFRTMLLQINSVLGLPPGEMVPVWKVLAEGE